MRQLIEQRLASYEPAADPLTRTLADVQSEMPAHLLQRLRKGRPSAVLLGLVERGNALHVVFTQRARHLNVHAGQISLPGGRLEPADTGPVAAALREATEEIGLRADSVEVVGELDSFLTLTGFLITPIVGFIDSGFEPAPDAAEVEAVFEVPLSFFLDPRNVARGVRERLGVSFRVYEFQYQNHRIWGATAAILMNLGSLISI